MSNKFTEKQYQKIVEISSQYIKDSAWGFIGTPNEHPIALALKKSNLMDEIDFFDSAEELMAIANPLTREWAHDKYVEKEKKFIWDSKNPLKDGDFVRLYKESDGDIAYVIIDANAQIESDELLTFKEVMNSIFDVNMFNKKEMK